MACSHQINEEGFQRKYPVIVRFKRLKAGTAHCKIDVHKGECTSEREQLKECDYCGGRVKDSGLIYERTYAHKAYDEVTPGSIRTLLRTFSRSSTAVRTQRKRRNSAITSTKIQRNRCAPI